MISKIIDSVLSTQVNKLTAAFISLLVRKGREINLPEIVNAFVAQFNKIRACKLTLTYREDNN